MLEEKQGGSPVINSELPDALRKAYDKSLYGAVASFPREFGVDGETLLSKELENKTSGAFVVLLRERKESGQKAGEMEVLLVKRNDYGGLWNLPGGGVDESESFADGAIREVEEETGLSIKLVKGTEMVHHAGTLDEESGIAGERRYDVYAGAIGVIVGGNLRLNPEAAAIQWFPVKDLPEGMYLKHKLLVHGYFIPPNFYELKKEIFFATQNHSFIPEGISG